MSEVSRRWPDFRVSGADLSPIVNPWPFRSWGIDIIGEIGPSSSKGDAYVLVATDYFTKWVDAKSYKVICQINVINFIKVHVIYRFGIPQSITVDNAIMFNGAAMKEFTTEFGIKKSNLYALICSS